MRQDPTGAASTSANTTRARATDGRSSLARRSAAPLAIVLCAILTGCTSGGSSSSDMDDVAVPGAVAPDVVQGSAESAAESADSDGPGDRSIVSQGSMSITAEDPLAAADRAVEIVEAAGGRIDSRAENPAESGDSSSDSPSSPTAQLIVRIPSATLSETLDDIEQLGETRQVSITATDVTTQAQDLDARITALTASTDRLISLLSTSASTTDLIAIETALSTRQSDLEALQAQRRSLSDQVDLATITASFTSIEDAPIETPETFLSGLASGWNSLLGFISTLVIAIGFALPWVAAATLVALVVLAIARTRRARPAIDERASDR